MLGNDGLSILRRLEFYAAFGGTLLASVLVSVFDGLMARSK